MITREVVSMLNDKEKQIISLRIQGMTLKKIGENFTVSPERIRQIEAKAWVKILRPHHINTSIDVITRCVALSKTVIIKNKNNRSYEKAVIFIDDLRRDNNKYPATSCVKV